MPNRALVMSGGGSKGAFQVGALDYLINDRGLDFQVIAGVSTGSLNAVIPAQGSDQHGLRAQFQALKDIYKHRFLAPFGKDSINSSDAARLR